MSYNSSLPSFAVGPTTVAFGTAIRAIVPPRRNRKTKVLACNYTSAGTAHTVTMMRPLGWTTLTADAAAAQAVINITRNPGAYAANALADGLPVPTVADNLMAASDLVILENPDGTLLFTTVSSITLLAVTLAANVPTGGAKAGLKLWWFGITTDLDPATGKAHPALLPTVSVTTPFPPTNGSGTVLFQSKYDHQPLIFNSDNPTATGSIDLVSGVYQK